jgi:hypothetical protein
MSGIGQGFQGDQWHGKQLFKNLLGLPIAGAIGSPQWIKKNPQSAMAAAAVAATILSAGAAAPAIAGATSAGSAAAGAGATGAFDMAGMAGTGLLSTAPASAAIGSGLGEGISSGLLGTLGSMGPEQAAILASQNSGLGFGADMATLNAANTAGGGSATLGAKLGIGLDKAGSVSKAFQTSQALEGLLSPKPMGAIPSTPHGPAPQYGQIGALAPDAPPKTPYSKFDPQWVDYLKRHPELGAMYG